MTTARPLSKYGRLKTKNYISVVKKATAAQVTPTRARGTMSKIKNKFGGLNVTGDDE